MGEENNKEYIEIITRLTKIETKIDEYSRVKDKADEAYTISKQNKLDIEKIQEANKWISRLLVGETIGLVFGIILAIIKIKL